MTSLEHIQQLIEEIGPATQEVLEVRQSGAAAWELVLEGEAMFGVDFVEERQVLVLSAELGAPPPGKRESLYELALLYHFDLPSSGGLKVGLDGPAGDLVLMLDIHAAGLDLTALQQAMGYFTEKMLAWRTLVAAGVGTGADTAAEAAAEREAQAAFTEVLGGGALRV